MLQYCESKQSDVCLTFFQHIQAAVGNDPQNCSRRGQLVCTALLCAKVVHLNLAGFSSVEDANG